MKFNENNIIPSDTKFRTENGKQIKYVITNDSFEDDYGSYKYDYNAWRIEDGIAVRLTNGCFYYQHSDARSKITFGYHVQCRCCDHTKFVREEDMDKQPKFYSKEEVDKMTSEAYNQGYKDGKAYFYGMSSKDEERVKQIAKTL